MNAGTPITGMRLLNSEPETQIRCAVRGPNDRLKRNTTADVLDWSVCGPEWKGYEHEASRRGESLPPLGGAILSTKGSCSGMVGGRQVMLEHGIVRTDGCVLVDWTD